MTFNLSEFLLAIEETPHDFTLRAEWLCSIYLFFPVFPSIPHPPSAFFKAGSHFIDQASRELIEPPVSASQVLRLKTHITVPSPASSLKDIPPAMLRLFQIILLPLASVLLTPATNPLINGNLSLVFTLRH